MSTEIKVITGFDPMMVTFVDQSTTRSFPTKYWSMDFGDSFLYAYLSTDETSAESKFYLSGDDFVVGAITGDSSMVSCLNGTTGLFSNTNVTNPFSHSQFHITTGFDKHYTGIDFTANGYDTTNGAVLTSENSDGRYTRVIGGDNQFVSVAGLSTLSNTCNRQCISLDDTWPNVGHIYKGAGVYLASMTCSSDKETGSWYLNSDNFSPVASGVDESYYLVMVYPSCPVSDIIVRGTNTNHTKFAAITSKNFTCDDPMSFSACTGWVSPVSYVSGDSSVLGFTGVSGYAPFLQVEASGVIVPRSLPITGAIWDWSDWFSDYTSADQTEFGKVIAGWPNWNTEKRPHGYLTATGAHTYIMPGLYSVALLPQFDEDRISKFASGIDYDYCLNTDHMNDESVSADCVMVYEIPPTGGEIVWDQIDESVYPTVVSGMCVSGLTAGSFPICRIDWDFGDGSDILTVSRYLSTHYDEAGWIDETETDNYWVGVTSGGGYYQERDPRNLSLTHTYERTNIEDHCGGYYLSMTAYACNTDTPISLSCCILSTSGAAMPTFSGSEGDIHLIDTRVFGDENNTMMVIESEKTGQLYTLKYEE